MKLEEKQNYLETKFSLDNLKQKESVMKNRVTFTGFDRINSGADLYIKEYYDTPDFFLQERGITINKNTVKGSKTSELIVRFDTGKERKQFLSYIPDTFALEINRKDSIYQHSEYIANCLQELVPSGLSVDPQELANNLTRICTVTKKRESNRFINIKGLKLDIFFSRALFESHVSRKREEILMLEIISHSLTKVEEYNEFVKKISFNNPTLIKLQSSDIDIAKDLLFKEQFKTINT